MAAKENEFRKEIHLPKSIRKDLEVQAIRLDFGDMKTMIEQTTIRLLEKWKQSDNLSANVQDHIDNSKE